MTEPHVLWCDGQPILLAPEQRKPRPCSHTYQLRVGTRWVCVCQLGSVHDEPGSAR